MRKYTIELDEATSDFFEKIATVSDRPVEKILADGLFKQVEIIMLKVADSFDVDGR